MKSFIKKIWFWISSNKLESFLVFTALLLGGFLRLYKISQYMTFLGDEGRDALIVKRLLAGDLVFVGPGTSVGNMYLGPFYYYFMAPFLWLSRFDPTGPAVGVALLGVATIFLVWFMARSLFGKLASFFALFLYAVSPVVIIYSRHSWNPNIMPFFSLLLVYSVWKFWNDSDYRFILVAGFSFAVCLQSHYLGLSMLPFFLLFMVLSLIESIKRNRLKSFLFYSALSFSLFWLLMLPLLLFDAKYGWRNLNAFLTFLFGSQKSVTFSLYFVISKIFSVWNLLVTRLIAAKDVFWGQRLSLIIFLLTVWKLAYLFKRKKLKSLKPFVFVVFWVLISVLLLSFYKERIYDHYFGFAFPSLFLLLSSLLSEIYSTGRLLGKIIAFLFFIFLFALSLYYSPIKDQPNRQLERSVNVAKKILGEAKGQNFNLAVIAERNYEGAYLYFLELWKAPVVLIDPQRADETIADQLFVVCEYEDKEKCQPTSNPKAEVANFGWSKIENLWNIEGVILFKLVHNESGQPQKYF